MREQPDDRFELFDLRVEVVLREGEPVYCGARPGDHFELRGEMLHLPPGQGFSLYSLAAVLPLLVFDFNPLNLRDPKSEAVSTFRDLMGSAAVVIAAVIILLTGWTTSPVRPPSSICGSRSHRSRWVSGRPGCCRYW